MPLNIDLFSRTKIAELKWEKYEVLIFCFDINYNSWVKGYYNKTLFYATYLMENLKKIFFFFWRFLSLKVNLNYDYQRQNWIRLQKFPQIKR